MSYADNILQYGKYTVYHVVPPVILGILCEKTVSYLQIKYKLSSITAITLQVFMIILVLYVIETYVSKSYAIQWQNTTPGLFFIPFFFGVQYTLFNNIAKIANLKVEMA